MQVIQILGIGRELWEGPPLFLASYDVDARDGLGDVHLTPTWDSAQQFEDGAYDAARETQSTVIPLRTDGQPNRPLQGFTIAPLTVSPEMEEQIRRRPQIAGNTAAKLAEKRDG